MQRLIRGMMQLVIIALILAVTKPSLAQIPYKFTFTGEITSVDDSLNWFQGAYSVGAPVTGTYTYFDHGWAAFGGMSPSDPISSYWFFNRPNLYGAPIVNRQLQTTVGGNTLSAGPYIFFPFQVNAWNDTAGPFGLPGDSLVVSTGATFHFPAFMHDWAGDHNVDPYYDFFPLITTSLLFNDPTGQALDSTALPLSAPSLTNFPSHTGRIRIWDGNYFSTYAEANFNITSVSTVATPEAGSVSLLLGGGVGVGMMGWRRRRQK